MGLKQNYPAGWKVFRLCGHRFLALDNGRQVTIWGPCWECYGGYHDVESFARMYRRDGEALRLDVPTDPK